MQVLYLLVERPLEQSVTQPPHHHKEQGQVAAAPGPVSVQVDPQTHLVAVLTGVEGWREKRRGGGGGGIGAYVKEGLNV